MRCREEPGSGRAVNDIFPEWHSAKVLYREQNKYDIGHEQGSKRSVKITTFPKKYAMHRKHGDT